MTPERTVSTAERRRRIGRRHHLAAPGEPVEAVAAALLGLHATDPASVFLGALARNAEVTVPSMEEALYERRSLLKVLGMRRTMFVVPPAVARVVDAACTRALSAAQHRRLEGMLANLDLKPNTRKWIQTSSDAIVDDLVRNGEATARELSRRIPSLDIRVTLGEGSKWAAEVGVVSRLLFLLAVDGRIVRARPLGSWLSSQYKWAATEAWSPGALDPMDEDVARRDLVTAWLRTYGPGTTADLTWWTGLTKRAVVRALADAAAVEVTLDDGPGWMLEDDVDRDESEEEPWVALLPALDSTTMGWRKRDWYLDPEMAPSLFDVNGNAGPTVWASGRIVGGWGQRRDGSVVAELLTPVDAAVRRAIDAAAGRLSDWFAGTVATPRFRTPLERRLAAG